MNPLYRIRQRLNGWMAGRNGADELGVTTLTLSIVLQLAGAAGRNAFLVALSLAMYLWTLFRMLSKNRTARQQENRKLLTWVGTVRRKCREFINRQKGKKQYKYFKCPGCRKLLRLPRGIGEKTVTCPHCKKSFSKKA